MPLPRSLLTSEHSDLDLELTAGTWPEGLTGEIYLSAPEPDPTIGSALFGFGVVTRLSLSPGTHGAPPDRFAWRHNVIDSPTRRLHTAAAAFTPGPLGLGGPLGAPNMANTAPLPWGDRLFATWDVGRPVEIDAETLGFIAEVGSTASWGGGTFPGDQVLPFVFSSAHPVVDPDRNCMWSVKLTPADLDPFRWQPLVVRYDGEGTEVRTWPVAGARLAGSMHTITQTRDWLVLADSGNFKVDPAEISGGERSVLIDTEVPAFLVRKTDIENTPPGAEVPMRTVTIAPTTGHYYACYDDSDGVRILFEHMDCTDLGFRLRRDDLDATGAPVDPALVGMYNMSMGPSSMSEVTIDAERGVVTDRVVVRDDWGWNHQLSAMDWSTEGLVNPTSHHVVFQGWRPGAVSARALHAYRDRVDRDSLPPAETAARLVTFRRGSLEVTSTWEFPSLGDLPTSPAFAPRHVGVDPSRTRYAGAEPGGHDGHVVCPVLSDDGFRVDVFDAADLGAGPVATLSTRAGCTVPLLLHSAWAPRAVTAPDHERLSFADELDESLLEDLPPDLAAATRSVAADLSS